MKDLQNILNFYSHLNAEYLHPKGKKATDFLLKKIDFQANEKILELGFGTGTTLIYFASVYKSTVFYGIEHNNLMFLKGKSRIAACRLNNVSVYLNENQAQINFASNFFDKIYLESVLAIQEQDTFEIVVKELHRVLKPDGKLIINEGIWASSFSIEDIKAMNKFCKSKFGIIQASEKYPYISDWKLFFKNNNFDVESVDNLNNISQTKSINQPIFSLLISKLFSFKGFIRSKFNSSLRKQNNIYKKEMRFLSKKGKYLEGYVVAMRKLNQNHRID